MRRSIIVLLSLGFIPLASHAASTSSCNYADIAKLQDGVDGMSDAGQKDRARAELSRARDAMWKRNNADCAEHMGNVEQMNK